MNDSPVSELLPAASALIVTAKGALQLKSCS